jgi:8-oxo-dGTP pyrophosphatase MutT (NUDIX family)
MHRQLLLNLLDAYLTQNSPYHSPHYSKDVRMKHLITRYVESNETCFERDSLKGHITGSAWLIDPSETYVLLTHHKKLGKWLQLGGHCDGNLDVRKVALKEAKEESGISNIAFVNDAIFDLDIHEIPTYRNIPAHLHYDVRFLLKAETKNFVVSKESKELAWVHKDDLPKKTNEESMLQMHSKWLRFLRPAPTVDSQWSSAPLLSS